MALLSSRLPKPREESAVPAAAALSHYQRPREEMAASPLSEPSLDLSSTPRLVVPASGHKCKALQPAAAARHFLVARAATAPAKQSPMLSAAHSPMQSTPISTTALSYFRWLPAAT